MPGQLLYKTTNQFGTCSGQSFLWCRNRLDKDDAAQTAPDPNLSSTLTRIYAGHAAHPVNDTAAVLQRLNLIGSAVSKKTGQDAINAVTRRGPGVYVIALETHVIAVSKAFGQGPNGFCLFDPNEGLRIFESETDFLAELTGDAWMQGQLALPAHLVTITKGR
jgi:hypothetical protein